MSDAPEPTQSTGARIAELKDVSDVQIHKKTAVQECEAVRKVLALKFVMKTP